MKQRLRSMPHKKVSSNLVHTFVDISFMYKIGTMLSFDLRTCQLVSLCGPKIWSCASSHLHCIWKIWQLLKKNIIFWLVEICSCLYIPKWHLELCDYVYVYTNCEYAKSVVYLIHRLFHWVWWYIWCTDRQSW